MYLKHCGITTKKYNDVSNCTRPLMANLFPKRRNHHDVYRRAKSNLVRATRSIANRFRVRQAYAIERGEKPAAVYCGIS